MNIHQLSKGRILLLPFEQKKKLFTWHWQHGALVGDNRQNKSGNSIDQYILW
jgi:hypothetical protein